MSGPEGGDRQADAAGSRSASTTPMVICGGARTPFVRSFGKFMGATADDLARTVLVEVLARTGADPAMLDEVILGCAGPPVEAMNIARVAALRAGIPKEVPAVTVHRNCASGIEAVASGLRRVRTGEAGLMLVGGCESMTEAPFQLRTPGRRKLLRLATARGAMRKLRAALALRPKDLFAGETLRTALTDPFAGMLMGETAELLAREFGIERARQDQYAAASQKRSVKARDEGLFQEEIVPFFVPPRFTRMVDGDDGIREDSTITRLAKLRPVFDRRHGSVTVGNACQITDGAAALLVASREQAEACGLPTLGLVREVVTVGCDPRRMGLGPALAIPALLEKVGLDSQQIGLFEINEAFAVQVLACLEALGDQAPDPERLNVNGGAIALGHPVGATGVRIILTLLLAMRRRSERYGIASLCVGGGQGAAVLLENPEAA